MEKRPYHRGSVEDRFNARIVKEPSGCWEFNGYRFNGYGKFGISATRTVLAHRFAYELWVGPIPPGVVVHHRCENPACVNPAHLMLKPHGDHVREHALDRGVARNQYGEWPVARSAEERRIRERDWMREKRARAD